MSRPSRRIVGLHGVPVGNGHAGPPQHHRAARSRPDAGHISRLDVPVGAVRGQSADAARARHRHPHTRAEGLLRQGHVDRPSRGLSAGRGGRRRLPGVHLRHTLRRPGLGTDIHLTASQRGDRREDHQQRRLPRHGR